MKKLYENCLGSLNLEVEDIEGTIRDKNSSDKLKEIKKNLPSISRVLSKLHKEFDKDGVSQMLFEKYYNDPDSKYYQMTQDQILKLWDLKGQAGIFLGKQLDKMMQAFKAEDKHYQTNDSSDFKKELLDIDSIVSDVPDKLEKFVDREDLNKMYNNMLEFYKSIYETSIKNGYIPIITGSELDVINLKYKYKGRLDAIWYFKNIKDSSKDFIFLVDYKSTKEISTENHWDKMYGPLKKYDDCDMNIYTMQLYMYKCALVNTYKIPEGRIIPRILNITADHCKFFEPTIEYSDQLVSDVMKFYREN